MTARLTLALAVLLFAVQGVVDARAETIATGRVQLSCDLADLGTGTSQWTPACQLPGAASPGEVIAIRVSGIPEGRLFHSAQLVDPSGAKHPGWLKWLDGIHYYPLVNPTVIRDGRETHEYRVGADGRLLLNAHVTAEPSRLPAKTLTLRIAFHVPVGNPWPVHWVAVPFTVLPLPRRKQIVEERFACEGPTSPGPLNQMPGAPRRCYTGGWFEFSGGPYAEVTPATSYPVRFRVVKVAGHTPGSLESAAPAVAVRADQFVRYARGQHRLPTTVGSWKVIVAGPAGWQREIADVDLIPPPVAAPPTIPERVYALDFEAQSVVTDQPSGVPPLVPRYVNRGDVVRSVPFAVSARWRAPERLPAFPAHRIELVLDANADGTGGTVLQSRSVAPDADGLTKLEAIRLPAGVQPGRQHTLTLRCAAPCAGLTVWDAPNNNRPPVRYDARTVPIRVVNLADLALPSVSVQPATVKPDSTVELRLRDFPPDATVTRVRLAAAGSTDFATGASSPAYRLTLEGAVPNARGEIAIPIAADGTRTLAVPLPKDAGQLVTTQGAVRFEVTAVAGGVTFSAVREAHMDASDCAGLRVAQPSITLTPSPLDLGPKVQSATVKGTGFRCRAALERVDVSWTHRGTKVGPESVYPTAGPGAPFTVAGSGRHADHAGGVEFALNIAKLDSSYPYRPDAFFVRNHLDVDHVLVTVRDFTGRTTTPTRLDLIRRYEATLDADWVRRERGGSTTFRAGDDVQLRTRGFATGRRVAIRRWTGALDPEPADAAPAKAWDDRLIAALADARRTGIERDPGTITLRIPADTPPGAHDFLVVDVTDGVKPPYRPRAMVTLDVGGTQDATGPQPGTTPAPALRVKTPAPTAGQTVELEWSGFAANAAAHLYLDGVQLTTQPKYLDASAPVVSLRLPDAVTGRRVMRLVDARNNAAEAPIDIRAPGGAVGGGRLCADPCVTVVPASARQGQAVKIFVSGFRANVQLQLQFDRLFEIGKPYHASGGVTELDFTPPRSLPDARYTISVVDVTDPGRRAQADVTLSGGRQAPTLALICPGTGDTCADPRFKPGEGVLATGIGWLTKRAFTATLVDAKGVSTALAEPREGCVWNLGPTEKRPEGIPCDSKRDEVAKWWRLPATAAPGRYRLVMSDGVSEIGAALTIVAASTPPLVVSPPPVPAPPPVVSTPPVAKPPAPPPAGKPCDPNLPKLWQPDCVERPAPPVTTAPLPATPAKLCDPNMPRYAQPGCVEPPPPPPTTAAPPRKCDPNVPKYAQPGCLP